MNDYFHGLNMASKNSITTHISDDLVYSVIEREIAKTKKNRSEFLREILEKEFAAQIEEQKIHLNNMYSYTRYSDASSVYPLNVTIDSERQVTSDGFTRFNKIDEVLYHEYESHFFGMISFSLKQMINSIKNEVQGLIAGVFKAQWFNIESQYDSADINLVFINRVDVSLFSHNDGKFYVRMKIHFHVSRFLFSAVDNDKDFLRIDFLNIKYLRFKDVAINGCLSKQYERYLYLKPTKEVLLGGFFAGLLYRPKEKQDLMAEICDLLSEQNSSKNGMLELPDKFVKIHINSEQIKVDRRSFRKGFQMFEERRKILHAEKNKPSWLK